MLPGNGAAPAPKKRLACPLELDVEDERLLLQVLGFYHATLKDSPKALNYLASRGLDHPELVERFQLGFANRTLGYRLPSVTTSTGKKMRERLKKLGILRERSGHEHFNGSLVIPLFDEKGAVVQLYGRKITAQLRAGTPLHLNLPRPLAGVFNRESFQASDEIILCESLLDALSFWCAGFRNVTATLGTKGFIGDYRRAFEKHGIRRVFIAFDRDEAGDKAAARIAEELSAKGIACSRVLFPHGMDANEYALNLRPAEQSLELALRKAVPIGRVTKTPRKEEAKSGDEPSSQEPAPNLSLAASNHQEPPPSAGAPRVNLPFQRTIGGLFFRLGDRRYRVRGLEKNTSYERLALNLGVWRGERFFIDKLDLYVARQREHFRREAGRTLALEDSVIERDLGRLLLALEQMQEQQIEETLAPKKEQVSISEEEREEALALLRDPRLLERILEDFEALGLIGERTNKLVGYLAAISRKLPKPLAVLIQSSSAAGKSYLLEAILSLVPEEDQVKLSAMTGQSLFYMGESELEHKVLAVIEEEGAEKASYPLKLLHSEGELRIASTGKDPATGEHRAQTYHVKGPVSLLLTTTRPDSDPELLNRCLVLTVDEGREQTKRIHDLQRQRETLEGLFAEEERGTIERRHKNAQRLLRPLKVLNPHARLLSFVDDRTRTRRDHGKEP